jgi:hypothetical protein
MCNPHLASNSSSNHIRRAMTTSRVFLYLLMKKKKAVHYLNMFFPPILSLGDRLDDVMSSQTVLL